MFNPDDVYTLIYVKSLQGNEGETVALRDIAKQQGRSPDDVRAALIRLEQDDLLTLIKNTDGVGKIIDVAGVRDLTQDGKRDAARATDMIVLETLEDFFADDYSFVRSRDVPARAKLPDALVQASLYRLYKDRVIVAQDSGTFERAGVDMITAVRRNLRTSRPSDRFATPTPASGRTALSGVSMGPAQGWIEPGLWAYVRRSVEAEDWAKVPAEAAIYVEDLLRKRAGLTRSDYGKDVYAKALSSHHFELGSTEPEKSSWRAFGTGLAGITNVDRHGRQDRDDAKQYAFGVLGAASLIVTQLSNQYPEGVSSDA